MIPIMPTCIIYSKLCTDTRWEVFAVLKMNFVSNTAAWFALVLSIPIWFFLYNYLDQLRRDKNKREFCEVNDIDLVEVYDTDKICKDLFKKFDIQL